jgi:hypothetical protein
MYLVDRYLRAPFREVVDTIRAGQRDGAVAPGVRPDLLLFVLLGAGSHLFDVTALARESVGIDATAPRTREDIIVLLRTLFREGLFRTTATRRGGASERMMFPGPPGRSNENPRGSPRTAKR